MDKSKGSYLIPCDHALISKDGKPSMIGVFTNISLGVSNSPVTQKFFIVGVVHLRNPDGLKDKLLSFLLVKPDGQETVRIESTLTDDSTEQSINVFLHYERLVLEELGGYRLKVMLGTEPNIEELYNRQIFEVKERNEP